MNAPRLFARLGLVLFVSACADIASVDGLVEGSPPATTDPDSEAVEGKGAGSTGLPMPGNGAGTTQPADADPVQQQPPIEGAALVEEDPPRLGTNRAVAEASCTLPSIQDNSSTIPFAEPIALSCPCSRRPEGPASFSCPWGDGSSAAQALNEEGGSLALSGTASTQGVPFKVTLPRGALRRETQVTLTELRTPPPAGFIDFSPIYRVEPVELSLCVPGQIELPTSGGTTYYFPRSLAIYWSESVSGPFERVPDTYNNAGRFQGSLVRGGYYFAGYPEDDAQAACR